MCKSLYLYIPPDAGAGALRYALAALGGVILWNRSTTGGALFINDLTRYTHSKITQKGSAISLIWLQFQGSEVNHEFPIVVKYRHKHE